MFKKMRPRLLCVALAVQFFLFQFISVGWAGKVEVFDPKKVSVAVLSFPSSYEDRPFIEETAEAIRNRLNEINYFRVVDPETAQSVVNYHLSHINKDTTVTGSERYLGIAKTHWFDRQYEEATVTVDRAISSLRNDNQKGDLLVDALLTKAMILQETKQFDESETVFEEALSVNPSLSMKGLPISGKTKRVFNETKRKVLEREAGSLEIKSSPTAATIYLNGVKRGLTPVTLTGLPQGSYLLTLEASHYYSVNEPVYVTANTTQFISRKLDWQRGQLDKKFKSYGAPVKTEAVVQKEVKLAGRIGEALKVDKVILVSSERRKGESFIVVRTIDTALKAAYNPMAVSFEDMLKNKEMTVAKVAGDIDDQAKTRVLDNPGEHLQPDTGDIRVLRRKLPFYKTSLFYSLVGAVIGGGIGAAVGVLATRGGDSGGGGDEGGVEIEFE